MNCLFCDAKDVDSEHQQKCYCRLGTELHLDFTLIGVKCVEHIRDDRGDLIGIRRVDPTLLRYDPTTRKYDVQGPPIATEFVITKAPERRR